MKKHFKIALLCLALFYSSPCLQSLESGRDQELTHKQAVDKKYNLSICAVFTNEATHLKEWIEYHTLVGVDHFYLYNNNSIDNFKVVLEPYIRKSIVTLIDWPDCMNRDAEEFDLHWALGTQIPAYQNAASYRAINETKWLVFVDLDEYLVAPAASNLKEVLKKYDAYPGVVLSREFFDCSQRGMFAKRKLIIEATDKVSAPKESLPRTVEKTIFKPEEHQYFSWAPYKCIFKGDKKAIALDKKELHVNRYLNRDAKHSFSGRTEYALHAVNRAEIDDEESERFIGSRNGAEDTNSMQRFVAPLSKRIGLEPNKGTIAK